MEINKQELEKLYHLHYKSKFNPKTFVDGLKARLYRTQFGFLTEYHAYFIAKIVFGESNVTRDVKLDKIGVDFQIYFENNSYNIHIFVDTERSWYYRNKKSKDKNVDDYYGIHVNLPYSLKNNLIHSLKFLENGFGIYKKEYFEYLKQEIDNDNIKNNNIIKMNSNGFIYRN